MSSVSGICYFFGTFNPIHVGHLVMAEAARNQFNFERIVFIPACVPPHRQTDTEMAPFIHRLTMVQLACRSNPYFSVSDIEARREGPSYTVDTLRLLVPNFETRSTPVPVIIGSDALAQLESWHQPEVLIRHALFLQAPRETMAMQTHITLGDTAQPLKTQAIDMPLVGVSSTRIRRHVQQALSIRYLLPQAVADYIAWNHLYRLPSTSS